MKKSHSLDPTLKFSKLLVSVFCLALMAFYGGCAAPSAKPHANDQAIQKIANNIGDSSKKTLNPKGLCVIVADPQTGKILAIKGDAARFLTEPVSTFKPVSIVAALEKGKITPETKINCENGAFKIGNFTLKDHTPLGELKCDEILAKSSNIGTTKIAFLLEDQDFYDYARRFGFGEKTGIEVPGEIPGILHPPSKWGEQTKARMAIGQHMTVTPIQIAMAYCAIANGGKLMRPALGEESPRIIRRVCSERTANMVRKALESNVSKDGFGMAKVEGVSVGGSTGTAQAITPKGEYSPSQYVTMFAGFFPVQHPKYVVIVVVDEADLPPNLNYGGLVAAPIFAEITKKISSLPSN
jgi:cell division protein FtsI (penicillin-binding protein 3)